MTMITTMMLEILLLCFLHAGKKDLKMMHDGESIINISAHISYSYTATKKLEVLNLCLYILTSVKTEEAFIAHHLLEAVKAILVHELFHQGATAPLVLHACLHQINGVHCCGTNGYREIKKCLIRFWSHVTGVLFVYLDTPEIYLD